jgi:hypothetical protein
MYRPTAHEVETFTGTWVNTKNPRPDTISLDAIAHALANICRFGGHCLTFYSVAEHSVFVSRRLERQGYGRRTQMAGLLHDGAEAYLGDVPRPLKPLLGTAYERLSDRMDNAISAALGIDSELFHDPAVKSADNWALLVEARFLLPSKGANWAGSALDAWAMHDAPSRIIVPDYWLDGVRPELAERLFLDRYKEITS